MSEKLIEIVSMSEKDWPIVSRIYLEGINTGMATFETEVPSWEHWSANHLQIARFLATEKSIEGSKIIGWAALSPVSSRCVYGGVAEVSVYVSPQSSGQGVGKELMEALIKESEKQGYWTLQSGIFPENKPSIRLHEKVGFRRIGYRERIGKLDGMWKDNVLMERRSLVIGNE